MSRLDPILPEKSENTGFVKNHEGIEPVTFMVGLVPLIGLSVVMGSMFYAIPQWHRNDFNIARQAAYSAYWVLAIQILYLVVAVAAAYGGLL